MAEEPIFAPAGNTNGRRRLWAGHPPWRDGGRGFGVLSPRAKDPGWAIPSSTPVLVSPRLPFSAVLILDLLLVEAQREASPGQAVGRVEAAVLILTPRTVRDSFPPTARVLT